MDMDTGHPTAPAARRQQQQQQQEPDVHATPAATTAAGSCSEPHDRRQAAAARFSEDDDPWVAGAGSRQAAPHAADEVAPRCPSPTLDHLVGSAPPLGTLPELRDVRAAAAAPQQQHAGELRLAAGGAHACGASSNGAARPLMGRGEEGMNVEGLGTGVLPGAAEPRHTEESAASDSVDAEAVRREMEAAGLADELHHPHAPEGVVVARQGAGVGVGELHGHGQ